jgi:hypothetical protein
MKTIIVIIGLTILILFFTATAAAEHEEQPIQFIAEMSSA